MLDTDRKTNLSNKIFPVLAYRWIFWNTFIREQGRRLEVEGWWNLKSLNWISCTFNHERKELIHTKYPVRCEATFVGGSSSLYFKISLSRNFSMMGYFKTVLRNVAFSLTWFDNLTIWVFFCLHQLLHQFMPIALLSWTWHFKGALQLECVVYFFWVSSLIVV